MLFVVNPTAAGGRVGRSWPGVEQKLRKAMGGFDVIHTSVRGSATEIVRGALLQGEDDVVLVGGDGLVNEGVNGFLQDDEPVREKARLSILPVGSGSDYARTLGIPIGLDHAEEILASDHFRKVDVGKATFRDLAGRQTTRYFANILEAGAGGAVVDKVNRSSKPFGGRMAFTWAIITTLPSYRNEVTRVEVDGTMVAEEPMNSVVAANGRFYGSGLQPAPRAELDDGLFDVVLFGDIGFWKAVRNMGKLRRGELADFPEVTYLRGREIVVSSEARVLAEMDGELVGTLPMEGNILHRILPVRTLGP